MRGRYDLEFRLHAIRRMFERRISDEEVLKVIQEGNDRPIHVVLAVNEEENMGIVVTAYQPDPSLWGDNFRRRRKP